MEHIRIVRNAAFDARNFLTITAGWINVEFRHLRGTSWCDNGGPLVIPGLYDGRGKTFLFCGVSRISTGAGNYAGAAGTDGGRALGN